MQALFTPDSLSKIDTGPSGIGDPADVFLVPIFGDDNETVTGLTYNVSTQVSCNAFLRGTANDHHVEIWKYTEYTESKNPGEIIYRPSKSNRTVIIQAQCETKAESENDFVIQANGTTYDYAGIVDTFVRASRYTLNVQIVLTRSQKTGENGRWALRPSLLHYVI
jgi:hypothetical protein